MFLPKLISPRIKKSTVTDFKGINTSANESEDEFGDTINLSCSRYPTLSSRNPGIYTEELNVTSGMDIVPFCNKGIGYLRSRSETKCGIFYLYYNSQMLKSVEFPDGASQANALNFNGKTLLIKDNLAYQFDPDVDNELTALSKFGYTLNISAAHENPEYGEPTAALSLLYEDETEIGKFTSGEQDSDFPADAEVGDCHAKYLQFFRLVEKKADPSENVWQPVVSLRLRIKIGDGYNNFKSGDYIRLSGIKYWNWAVRTIPELERFIRVETLDDNGDLICESLPCFENMMRILEKRIYPTNDIAGYNYPIINNNGNALCLLGGKISACMPSLDYICAGANRVWGCNNMEHCIYSSELGNHRNWSVFEGGAGDSYAVTIGSPGDFSAACSYRGSPVFFKENEMIIINGSKPASFFVNSFSVSGVPLHSPLGVAVVGDVLYYISNNGICAYNGASVKCISDKTIPELSGLYGAVLGGEKNLLYISGKLNGEERHYIYDTVRGIWHRYSGGHTFGYLYYPSGTLEISEFGEGIYLRSIYGELPKEYLYNENDLINEEYVEWYWESKDISYNTTDSKYLNEVSIDASCSDGADLFISYDGDKIFSKAGHFVPRKRSASRIRIFPKRCNTFRLRMQGSGEVQIYNITKKFEEANENG